MALATHQPRTVDTAQALTSHRVWATLRKFILTKPLGAAGALVILGMAAAALFAEAIAPYDAYELNQRLQFGPPNMAHWFGTDEFGRDVLTRLIYGARIALFIGFASSFLGATAGAILGVVSAYLGGRTDLYLQRVMDIMLAFPLLILALAIVTVLGRSIPNLILAIAIPVIPRTARIVRSSALAAKENVYVEAARAIGSSHTRVMSRHIVPNVMAPYLIVLTAQLGGAILTEASLSFLGLGTAEPTPSWGLMLSGGAPMYAEKAPWLAIFPGVAISLAVFGFNLFGDSLRDALDPKLRHRT
jgi:peptide/nickel transport system permease protein